MGFENDDGADFLTPRDVVNADDGDVDDRRMTQQDSFDVQSADLVAAGSLKKI